MVVFLITGITGLFQGEGAVVVGMRLQLMSLNRSLGLICHMCFVPCRSLNMDFENQDKEKDNSSATGSFNGNSTNNSKGQLYSLPSLLHFSAAPPASPVHVFELLHCRFTWSQAVSGHSPPHCALILLSTSGSRPWKLNLKHQHNISIMCKNCMWHNLSGFTGNGNSFTFKKATPQLGEGNVILFFVWSSLLWRVGQSVSRERSWGVLTSP